MLEPQIVYEVLKGERRPARMPAGLAILSQHKDGAVSSRPDHRLDDQFEGAAGSFHGAGPGDGIPDPVSESRPGLLGHFWACHR
jgi:hypothetical protein